MTAASFLCENFLSHILYLYSQIVICSTALHITRSIIQQEHCTFSKMYNSVGVSHTEHRGVVGTN